MRIALLLVAVCLAASSGIATAADVETPPRAPAVRTAEQMALLRKVVLDGLADERAPVRVSAAKMLMAAWPDSAPILDEALASKSAAVRLEAVNLLADETLGDTRDRLRKKFDDASPDVRRQAIRIGRHLKWPEIEADLMRLAIGDAVWIVRQEALRGLEDRGTWKCLHVVLDGWLAERDAEHRRRFKRVLVAILKVDRGDDAEAWRKAVDDAEALARATAR